jgi:alpha-glucosidase
MSWWDNAVVYQIYPRSYADSSGDGEGDLRGIIARLPHLVDLGVDAVWLSPFYPSPMNDSGYDVSDYCAVDPRFGDLDDFDALVAAAGEVGLRVIVDIVPNHCSDQHPLFQKALAAPPGSPERDLFMFRDKPNNWPSFFGGSAWTQLPAADGKPGQYYLHLFDSTQPDWNWRNPAVPAMFEEVLRFWLSGMRCTRKRASPTCPSMCSRRRSAKVSAARRTRTSPSSTTTTAAGGACSTRTARTASPASGSWSARPGLTTPH